MNSGTEKPKKIEGSPQSFPKTTTMPDGWDLSEFDNQAKVKESEEDKDPKRQEVKLNNKAAKSLL